ncbi:aminotransferase class V-fold PLP-dependent enzyme [Candidatus Kaiserbacteria bacterium]|nr:aminotransferase class V-fold PLP-dependent enzyme [Candidatus Kaiserbacteria bacterium]
MHLTVWEKYAFDRRVAKTADISSVVIRGIMALFHHKNDQIAISDRVLSMFWKKRVYLDHAAGVSANPSSPHEEGRHAKQMLEDARASIARLIEVQSDDVIFTSGATESNALAILGIPKVGDHVLYLPSAHASIVENMKLLGERGVNVEALPIKESRVDTEALAKMIRPETVLVSMDAVCGETGVVWNTREVRQTIGPKMLLHIDASQAPLTEKMTRAHFAADLLTLDASKVGAIRGIGVLVAHRTIPITPLYRGGGQERGLRSGSEAPELARGFAAALGAAVRGREAFRISATQIRRELVESIQRNISNVQIHEGRVQVPHILNISLIGRDTDYLVALLDEAGFAVSTRSACETDSEEGSRAVYALTGNTEWARTTLRISWDFGVRPQELRNFAKALAQAVTFIDSSSSG